MTFWWSNDNYGQILQAYALQEYLNKLGHDTFIIKYRYINETQKRFRISKVIEVLHPNNTYKYLKRGYRIYKTRATKKYNHYHERQFDNFRAYRLHFSSRSYSNIDELRGNPPDCDLYIAGSDQIWNFFDIHGQHSDIEAYTLAFGKPTTKRISYASSFGSRTLNEAVTTYFRDNIKNVDCLSVREREGVSFLDSIGIKGSKLVSDPAFLLSKTEYEKIMSVKIQNKTRPFLYFLGNRTALPTAKILDYFVERSIQYDYTSVAGKNDWSANCSPTIEEWLAYIYNANMVITNSFHGVVFSLIFNKEFFVLPLAKGFKDMNVRIDTLLEDIGLGERKIWHISKFENIMNRNDRIDWTSVNKFLELRIRQSKEYLEMAVC